MEASQGQKGSVGLHLGLGLLLGQAQGLPAQDPQDQDRLEVGCTRVNISKAKYVCRQPQLRLHLREKWRLQGDVCRTSSGGQDSGKTFMN